MPTNVLIFCRARRASDGASMKEVEMANRGKSAAAPGGQDIMATIQTPECIFSGCYSTLKLLIAPQSKCDRSF